VLVVEHVNFHALYKKYGLKCNWCLACLHFCALWKI